MEEEAAATRELQLLKEQELSNLLHQKDYIRAVGVAISLDQPYRVRTILQGMQYNTPWYRVYKYRVQYSKVQANGTECNTPN